MRNEDMIREVQAEDITVLQQKEEAYGDSWIKRGLNGAYFVIVRKIDRIENQMKNCNYDLHTALKRYGGNDGILDDINDLSRYLLLLRAELAVVNEDQIKELAGMIDTSEPNHHYTNQD